MKKIINFIRTLNLETELSVDNLNDYLEESKFKRKAYIARAGVHSYVSLIVQLFEYNKSNMYVELCKAYNIKPDSSYGSDKYLKLHNIAFFLEFIMDTKKISKYKLVNLVDDGEKSKLRILLKKARTGLSSNILLSTLMRYLNGIKVHLVDFIFLLPTFCKLIPTIIESNPKYENWLPILKEKENSLFKFSKL